MATVTKSGNALLITSTGSQDDELILSDFQGGFHTAAIEVVSGSIQFNVGDVVSSANATYTDDDKLVLTFGTGVGNIHYKAGAASQTFRISV